MLEGEFREAKEGVVSLPEDCPIAFEIFVNWLYADCMPFLPRDLATTSSHVLRMAKFHMLAERFLLPQDVKASILDHFVYEFSLHKFLPLSDLQYILRNTFDNCPVRALAKDMFCYAALAMGQYNHEEVVKPIVAHGSETETVEILVKLFEHERFGVPTDLKSVVHEAYYNVFWPQDVSLVSVRSRDRYRTGYLKSKDETEHQDEGEGGLAVAKA
ncbi:MAG: hypothetical protein Q9160_005211 [Pyrenula sp. 1 TL-2023]